MAGDQKGEGEGGREAELETVPEGWEGNSSLGFGVAVSPDAGWGARLASEQPQDRPRVRGPLAGVGKTAQAPCARNFK